MTYWHRWFDRKNRLYSQKLLESLLSMAWFVEARDPYTGGHLWRVSRYAYLLARVVDLSEADTAGISLGGFLHDLGKIGVPDSILQKSEKLTDEEYSIIKTHPDIGLRMLSGHPLAALVAEAVGKHHERPDSKGYPYGLKKGQIPIDALIVGISDAFDAMTSHRPYREAMSEQKALSILEAEAGKQFDEKLVKAFAQLGRQGKLAHVIGHSDDGIPLRSCPVCGPTLVVRREQKADEKIYCRNCTGEFKLVPGPDGIMGVAHTGKMGGAADLKPEADMDLISRSISEIVDVLPIADLLQQGAKL